MITETFSAEQTWQLLWSRAAHQVITHILTASNYRRIAVGYGWGLRSPNDPQRALVLHPSSNMRGSGDLALTITGAGTQVIPRHNASYVEYIQRVSDVVEDALTY